MGIIWFRLGFIGWIGKDYREIELNIKGIVRSKTFITIK